MKNPTWFRVSAVKQSRSAECVSYDGLFHFHDAFVKSEIMDITIVLLVMNLFHDFNHARRRPSSLLCCPLVAVWCKALKRKIGWVSGGGGTVLCMNWAFVCSVVMSSCLWRVYFEDGAPDTLGPWKPRLIKMVDRRFTRQFLSSHKSLDPDYRTRREEKPHTFVAFILIILH